MLYDALLASSIEQPMNASGSTVALIGMLTDLRAEQSSKERNLIDVMVAGMWIHSRDDQ